MCVRSAVLLFLIAICGCGQPPAPSPPPAAAPVGAAPKPTKQSASKPPREQTAAARPPSSPFWEAAAKEIRETQTNEDATPRTIHTPLAKPQVDDQKAAALGIRKIDGKRLVLYTDIPSRPEIDGLPELADQAYPQWCQYFEVSPDEQPGWQMIGYLIKDKPKFQQAGLFPDSLPNFGFGFCRDHEFWMYDQQADYYRRHLLLHEMTHGFMYTRLRTSAPPWYMEGIAELLATHKLADGKLELNCFPQRPKDVPDWGRIKIVQDGYTAGKAPFFKQVLAMPLEAHLQVENYGWCWAAAALLDGHPRYRDRFRQVARDVAKPGFDERFRKLYGDDWLDLCEEWQLFVGWIEFGFDLKRAAIDFQPGDPLPAGGAKMKVAADRGWQSTRLRLQAGQSYKLKATGRYEVAQEPKPWISEPGGVSIRYYKHAPLGILGAAVRPDVRDEDSVSSFFRGDVVGLERTIKPTETGTLYLRINDSNAELADNRGELEVEILADK